MVKKQPKNGTRRIRTGLGFVIFGFALFMLGVEPGLFGLDRSPVVGFVQIAVFLIGLGIICVGGYMIFSIRWAGGERTIAADVGLRLVTTGYVIAFTSGMADVFGFGTQPWPRIPLFGPIQIMGVVFGEIVIAVGFLLLLPPRLSRS